MAFAHPYFLLLLLLLPLLAWLKGKRGVPPAFVYSSVQLVRGMQNITRSRAGGFLMSLRWLTLAHLHRGAGAAAFDEKHDGSEGQRH